MLAHQWKEYTTLCKGQKKDIKHCVKGKRKSINVHKLYDIFEAYSLHESVIVKDNMLAEIENN